jgi:phosphofructokinase-like protein
VRLGLSTGGGDCPGLNAVIRAVVKHGIGTYGAKVIGIEDSFNGLMDRPMRVRELGFDDVTDILARGGTILGTTNQGDPFNYPPSAGKARVDRSTLLVEAYKQLQLDAMIVVGGDGTQAIAARLTPFGVNVIGVPKTIDNDLAGTDQTIGFDTAVQVASDSVSRLHSTAESHDRIMILEVMGRDAGFIALHAGMAGAANIILLPEIPFEWDAILAKIEERKRLGRYFSLVVVAEGAFEKGQQPTYAGVSGANLRLGGIGGLVAHELTTRTGLETRVTVLGHIQRGGSPSPLDRNLATAFGAHAVDLAAQKRYGRVVVLRGAQVSDVAYADVAGRARPIDLTTDPYVRAAEAIGICLGRMSRFKATP